MSAMPEILATIRSILSRRHGMEQVADDEELLQVGLLDSVGVLSLVTEMEEAFGLRIEMEHLTEDNFHSIRAMGAMVDRLLTEGGPS